jgi:cell division protein FtsQ
MAVKVNIRKILFLSLWVVLGAGLLVLLVAAISKKNHATCKGVAISIKGGTTLFLDRQDILNVIAPGKNNPYKGRPLASFDLHRLEELLKRDVWVRDADLFFDGNGLLKVNIDEREPIARVFTESGSSFYLDSAGAHLPLSDKMAIRLPVFTGFPTDKTVLRGADSLLQQQVKQLSLYMTTKDTFWLAQVQQVDITPARGFEMIPVIGNHVIEFGDGSDYEAKFHRLLLFYQQVAARVGFDKYSTVDVQYKGQVIGTKKGTVSKVDSLQALKNVQKMIEASKQVQADTLSTIVDNNIMASGASGSILPVLGNPPPSPHPVQKPAVKPVVKPPVKPKQQPRAVMKPR